MRLLNRTSASSNLSLSLGLLELLWYDAQNVVGLGEHLSAAWAGLSVCAEESGPYQPVEGQVAVPAQPWRVDQSRHAFVADAEVVGGVGAFSDRARGEVD